MANFKDWWNRIGSAIRPIDGHGHYEHAKRVAGLAVKACCKVNVPDTHFEFNKEELDEVCILVSESVNRGIMQGYVGAVYYEMSGGHLVLLQIEIVQGVSRHVCEWQMETIDEYIARYA